MMSLTVAVIYCLMIATHMNAYPSLKYARDARNEGGAASDNQQRVFTFTTH